MIVFSVILIKRVVASPGSPAALARVPQETCTNCGVVKVSCVVASDVLPGA